MNLSADDEMLSGMGCLIAKEIVRMHEDYMGVYGGRIEAVDCADGTMIRFTLPF
jgi:signal transduction histidine kinase